VKLLSQLTRDFHEPECHRLDLPGGLLLLAEPVPQVSSLALGVWVRIGSRDEEPEVAGITHFIEHLVFKGSRRHSGYQLAKRMEAIGGQVDAYTTKESTCFYARVFEGHRREAVEILAELICQASFESEMIRRELGVIDEEIKSYEDTPEELILDLAAEVLWPGHPLGRPILGSSKTLRSLRSRSVRAYHHRRYASSNTLVAAAGRVDVDRLAREVSRSFHLPRRHETAAVRRIPRFRQMVRHHEREVSQASLCLIRRGPSYRDRNRHAVYVLNTILGAGASSRLFQSIREDEGLAYSVYSFMDSFRDTGMFGVYLGVSPERMERALRLTCRELRRIRRHGVKAWELESAKAQIFAGLFLSYESMYERITRLAHNETYYGAQVPLLQVVRAIDGLTREDIQQAAAELLDPGSFSLVTLGPAGHPRPGIEDLDF